MARRDRSNGADGRIDWNAPSYLLGLDGPRQEMPLRDAIERIMEMPERDRVQYGIGLNTAIEVWSKGRCKRQLYLSSSDVRNLVGDPEHDEPFG